MSVIKNILTLSFFCLTLPTCGQTKTDYFKEPEFKVLASFISFEGGDKLHSAKFRVIKCLNDSIQLKDTIKVWYYNYLQPDTNIKTVILKLNRYDRQSNILKDNLYCVDNNGKTGITKAKIEYINFKYWEICETGKGECKPLNFVRQKNETNWFLVMPCGGTQTSITISSESFVKRIELKSKNCPPYLELTSLNDGKYFANMLACGLGGSIIFNLKTN
jgi:hypothetical protein